MSVEQAYNFRKVDDLVSTAGVLTPEQLKQLSGEGYAAVINLLPEQHEYATPDEASIVEQQGVEYCYIPVDFSAPTMDDYEKFSKQFRALEGRKVLLHCAANYRVSAFYAIYAVRNLGWSENRARDFIASLWDLNEYPVWREFVVNELSS